MTRWAGRPRIAIYADSFDELTFTKLSAGIAALPQGLNPLFVDYGPVPIKAEASSVPPWTGQVAAVIVDAATSGDPAAFADWIRRGGVPAVSFNAELVEAGIPTACADHHELGRLAAAHLVNVCGCRSFVHVGSAASQATPRRLAGFRLALAERGLEARDVRTSVIVTADEPLPPRLEDRSFVALLKSLRGPVGVFASLDSYAAGVVDLCRRIGLRVPEDVAVVGVGNTMLAHTHRPSLSSIQVPRARMGAAGIGLLVQLLNGVEVPPEAMIVGGSVLRARESTVGRNQDKAALTVNMALERIRAKAHDGLTVDRLAEVLGVSDRWLRQLFEEELGVSPNEEIQRVRFEEAARLLKLTQLPVGRIAAMVGFSHAAGLSMFFRRMIRMTPREYRAGGGELRPSRR